MAIVGGLLAGFVGKQMPGPDPYFLDDLHFHGMEELHDIESN